MLLLKKITVIIIASGYVTFYNPVGKTLSCPRVMGEAKWRWKWHGKRGGIAHRWLPCGTEVYVKVGSRVVKTRVVDRGPYGAIDKEGKYVVASPKFLKKWWNKKYQEKGKELSDEEVKRLSRVLPDGWKWRCIADILYSLKPKLKIKGGRQPGSISMTRSAWKSVKDLEPENEVYMESSKKKKSGL